MAKCVKFDFRCEQIAFPFKIPLRMAWLPLLSDRELIYLQSKSLSPALTVNKASQWLIGMLHRWKADKVSATTPQVTAAEKWVNALYMHYHTLAHSKLLFYFHNNKPRAWCQHHSASEKFQWIHFSQRFNTYSKSFSFCSFYWPVTPS